MDEIMVGKKVKVYTANSNMSREGEIIYKSAHFFTVDFKNYPESFQYFELKTGNIRIEFLG